MAQAGITADMQPLSDAWGFADLYGGEHAAKDVAANVLEGLGEALAIETEGLLMKRFPCCGAAHRTLDAIAELRNRHRLSLESVERVEAFIPAFARANLRFDEPCDEMQARFSLTYCAVRVLQNGELTLRDMTGARVHDPLVRPWLQRVVVHTKPGSVSEELGRNATPAITRIVLKTGLVHEIGIRSPKGSPDDPLSEDEKRRKFRDCCRWAGRVSRADELYDLARSIYRMPRFSEFSRAFAMAFGT
jgi:2-methylcitrate dehydratase PrpD